MAFLPISCFCLVDDILSILEQPKNAISGPQPHFPQITDLSQMTSEAGHSIQLPHGGSFDHGKHQVLSYKFTDHSGLKLVKFLFL